MRKWPTTFNGTRRKQLYVVDQQMSTDGDILSRPNDNLHHSSIIYDVSLLLYYTAPTGAQPFHRNDDGKVCLLPTDSGGGMSFSFRLRIHAILLESRR